MPQGASGQGGPRARLAADGITPEIFRTETDDRTALRQEARRALRQLAGPSARSGQLSPLGYNLTISHQHRFVWFRVAKVATRTILNHFAENGVPLDVNHAMRMRYPRLLFADYFKFAFVRHPLDRFVSAWQNKVVQHNHFGFDDETLRQMQQVERFAHWAAEHDLSQLASADIHLAQQTRLIDLSQIDYLGRLETFARDFAEVCAHTGTPVTDAVALNSSVSESSASDGSARSAASAELRSLVAAMYRKDFQVFGYRPD